MTLTPAEQHVDHVLDTLRRQREKGRAKYGRGLDHRDDYDWQGEALQELADAVQYLAAENLRLRELLRKERESFRDLSENWDCDDDAQAEALELAAKRLVATARRCRDMARGIRLLQKGRQ